VPRPTMVVDTDPFIKRVPVHIIIMVGAIADPTTSTKIVAMAAAVVVVVVVIIISRSNSSTITTLDSNTLRSPRVHTEVGIIIIVVAREMVISKSIRVCSKITNNNTNLMKILTTITAAAAVAAVMVITGKSPLQITTTTITMVNSLITKITNTEIVTMLNRPTQTTKMLQTTTTKERNERT
jgi:hypothetical protein